MSGGNGHWLDRLAVSQTRRQLVRSALAGAALTLPFARSAAASGVADPHACRKGCFYTAQQQYLRASGICDQSSGVPILLGNVLYPAFVAPTTALLSLPLLQQYLCKEAVALAQKARQYDCLQPDCPGFDPKGPDGPCELCVSSGGTCCPDQKQHTGYACCTAAPAGCCKDDGCHSGTTDCGG